MPPLTITHQIITFRNDLVKQYTIIYTFTAIIYSYNLSKKCKLQNIPSTSSGYFDHSSTSHRN